MLVKYMTPLLAKLSAVIYKVKFVKFYVSRFTSVKLFKH